MKKVIALTLAIVILTSSVPMLNAATTETLNTYLQEILDNLQQTQKTIGSNSTTLATRLAEVEDSLTEYELKPKNVWVYNRGDECIDVSGGWRACKWRGGLSSLTSKKEVDRLYSYGVSNTAMYTGAFGWQTVNQIDLTDVQAIRFVGNGYNNYNNGLAGGGISNLKYPLESITGSTASDYGAIRSIPFARTGENEFLLDVSELAGSYYIHATIGTICAGYIGTVNLYEVQLIY